jgi:peptidyl-prolyl cis-trans isomerase D
MWRMKDKTLSGVEAEKIQKNYPTYIVLLIALGAMTFFGVCDPTGRQGGPSGSAATVAGEVISRSEFNRAYRSAYDRYQRQFSEAFDPAALRLAHTVMKELVDDRAMYLKAVDLGLRASDDEIIKLLVEADQFKDEKSGKFDEESFKRFLDSQGYTEASFMEEIRRSVTLQKFQRFVRESVYVSAKAAEIDYKLAETKLNLEYLKFDPQKIEVTVGPEDIDKLLADEAGKKKIKDYYDSNTKEFKQPEQAKARHVLVSFKGARNATAEAAKREKDDARKRAQEIEARVKAPDADFAAIAKETTDEAAGKASGGDLGWFAREAMVKEFSEAAFAQQPGTISGIVESPFGFHIIKLEDKKAAKDVSLEAAQRQIAETILKKEKRPTLAKEQADKTLAALKEGKDVGAQLAEYKVTWTETGEIAANASYIPGVGSSKEITSALSGLTKAGQLSAAPVDVRGNLYVLRLKARKDPDMSKLDKDKRRELSQTASFSEGFAMYRSVEKQVTDELESKKRVWMNPEYLALDAPREKAKDDSKPSS